MQKLVDALRGEWKMSLNYAPTGSRPKGDSGTGQVVFRPGPGTKSLIEDEFSTDSSGKQSGMAVIWADSEAKGFRVLWCDDHIPSGCALMSQLARWEGDDFVISDQFERRRQKYTVREVISHITRDSYTDVVYQGVVGSESREIVSIRARREQP
jgi:hypothetical protein